jgi:hypothetical protein
MINEKIQRIAKDLEESGASQLIVAKIIKELSVESISESQLRENAFQLLKTFDPQAALVYEKFSRIIVFNSDEKHRAFNRGNILESLSKETNVPRRIAEKITSEVEEIIKDAKISFLTAGHIRELVCAKLSEYGLEDARNDYSRMGEPAFEVKKFMQENPQTNAIIKEYIILNELPRKARALHFEGKITIEDLEGFGSRAFAFCELAEQVRFGSKFSSFEDSVSKTFSNALQKAPLFYLPISICGLEHSSDEKLSKKSATLIKNFFSNLKINTSFQYYNSSFFSQISKSFIASNANALLNENSTACVDSKYALKLFPSKSKIKNYFILNCSKKDFYSFSNGLYSDSRGIDLFVNLNLEKVYQTSKDFYASLEEIAVSFQELREAKKKLLSSRKYFEKSVSGIDISELTPAIGLTVIYPVAKALNPEKPLEECHKILKEIKKIFQTNNIFPASKHAVERFSEFNNAPSLAQDIFDVESCEVSKKTCLTGVAHNLKEVSALIEAGAISIKFESEEA